jgi:hypothetical protein
MMAQTENFTEGRILERRMQVDHGTLAIAAGALSEAVKLGRPIGGCPGKTAGRIIVSPQPQ